MVYYPNREPSALLACGCITTMWGAMNTLGERGWFLFCEEHPKPGGQKIIRKPSTQDYVEYIRRERGGSQETLF